MRVILVETGVGFRSETIRRLANCDALKGHPLQTGIALSASVGAWPTEALGCCFCSVFKEQGRYRTDRRAELFPRTPWCSLELLWLGHEEPGQSNCFPGLSPPRQVAERLAHQARGETVGVPTGRRQRFFSRALTFFRSGRAGRLSPQPTVALAPYRRATFDPLGMAPVAQEHFFRGLTIWTAGLCKCPKISYLQTPETLTFPPTDPLSHPLFHPIPHPIRPFRTPLMPSGRWFSGCFGVSLRAFRLFRAVRCGALRPANRECAIAFRPHWQRSKR